MANSTLTRRPARRTSPKRFRRPAAAPTQKPLYVGVDNGRPVRISPDPFAPKQREGGWGAYAESFLRVNGQAFQALDVEPLLRASDAGVDVFLKPGGRAGAVPLRSAQHEQVIGGLVVKPRFGWAGVGRVLSETGWAAAPELIDMPLVPGSGREVPPWVIAGPVLRRLADLLASLKRGYVDAEEVLTRPRGRILWNRYRAESLARGRWHELPCRFPNLTADPNLRRYVKWTLERILRALLEGADEDPMARHLVGEAKRLLLITADVVAASPTRQRLDELARHGGLAGPLLARGIEAIGWIFDERGLGGGRELDGLAWHLQLDRAWEAYVEAITRSEAALTGGTVRVGRLGQTVFPLHWTNPIHRTLGHLVPDIVVQKGTFIHVIDAKYKAHLAELDEHGWRSFADVTRQSHRADLHQVLAYAALFEADHIRATLMYPLRRTTFHALAARGQDRSIAELGYGGRRAELELRGLPFGS